MSLRDKVRTWVEALQESICAALEKADGAGHFVHDRWSPARDDDRIHSGGGLTRVLVGGGLFEKAGVNVSAVEGRLPARIAQKMRVPCCPFFATGISLVVHPESPLIPTAHMNVRYFELEPGDCELPEDRPSAWFGGGADLTPYYLFEGDVRHFHLTWKSVCDRHDPELYPGFKKWCDEYFFVKHRGEARGVGGIFFDYLGDDLEARFALARDVGESFVGAYLPIVERHRDESWTEAERQWQLIRRGRYVEFNLVYDRGTLFGLETGGRSESILMSMPPLARWAYAHVPEKGSREEELLQVLRKPRSWV